MKVIDIFGLLSVVIVLVSLVICFMVKSLLVYAAIGLLGGMVCLLVYVGVSFERLSAFFTRQSTKYGLNLLVTVIVLLVIIGFIEVIASRHNKRFDLTPEKMHTLSPLTKKVLEALDKGDKEVKVIVFYQREEIFEFRDLLKKYRDETSKISYQFFNLDQNPERAREYGISSYGAIAVESQGKRRTFNYCMEENVTNGIISVTREGEEVVYFIKGHGEGDFTNMDERVGYSHASFALGREGYTVKGLLLLRKEKVPKDAAVLIISGPKEEYLPTELQAISDYILGGGRVLFMIDPYTVPRLVNYLKDYNILVGNNMVVDKESKLFAGDIFSPLVLPSKRHAITENINKAMLFPLVCSVELIEPPKSGKVVAKSLAQTSPESWAETDRESIAQGGELYFQEWEDKEGPISVVAVAEVSGGVEGKTKGKSEKEEQKEQKGGEVPIGRIAVCGDSDFASNLYFAVLSNRDFFLNIVNWLSEEEKLISIRHKTDQTYPFSPLFLTENQKKVVFWFSVVLQPLLILSIGIFIYARRKIRG